MRPCDILMHLKCRDPTNVSSMKTIYNAQLKMRVLQTCGHTHMQQLMKLIYDHGYIERLRVQENGEVVTEIFFAHPKSIQLVHAFPLVFMMDCTYKANQYRMPLLEIVGEKEDNYAWVMECFKLLFDGIPFLKVIITDHELGLMKAVSMVFPSTVCLLCRVHIGKNVLKNCRKAFFDLETSDKFNGAWFGVMKALTEEEFCRKLQLLEDEFCAFPNELSYLHKTWVVKHRERFVSA
ncbi:hypothetical protein QJS04_geneDACA012294 [Acorus gramineus]|uniref:MULE transposase domain-containing protein n=1 Tax=Acorus gramineus TaxID=55184 RepID=A0AAV8ZZW6_ACOGR|nr:hypothetical protein QJS04_geneDACA012294 [Acorus gramineus]